VPSLGQHIVFRRLYTSRLHNESRYSSRAIIAKSGGRGGLRVPKTFLLLKVHLVRCGDACQINTFLILLNVRLARLGRVDSIATHQLAQLLVHTEYAIHFNTKVMIAILVPEEFFMGQPDRAFFLVTAIYLYDAHNWSSNNWSASVHLRSFLRPSSHSLFLTFFSWSF